MQAASPRPASEHAPGHPVPPPSPLQAPAAAGGGTVQPVAAACPSAAAPPAQPVAREAAQEARGGSAEGQQQSGLPSDSLVVQSDVSIAVAQACPELAPASSGPAVFVTPHESERLQASPARAAQCSFPAVVHAGWPGCCRTACACLSRGSSSTGCLSCMLCLPADACRHCVRSTCSTARTSASPR